MRRIRRLSRCVGRRRLALGRESNDLDHDRVDVRMRRRALSALRWSAGPHCCGALSRLRRGRLRTTHLPGSRPIPGALTAAYVSSGRSRAMDGEQRGARRLPVHLPAADARARSTPTLGTTAAQTTTPCALRHPIESSRSWSIEQQTSRAGRWHHDRRLQFPPALPPGTPVGPWLSVARDVRGHHCAESAAVAGRGVPVLPDASAARADHAAAAAGRRPGRPAGHLLHGEPDHPDVHRRHPWLHRRHRRRRDGLHLAHRRRHRPDDHRSRRALPGPHHHVRLLERHLHRLADHDVGRDVQRRRWREHRRPGHDHDRRSRRSRSTSSRLAPS